MDKIFKTEWLGYLLTMLITLCVVMLSPNAQLQDIHLPLSYGGDGLFSATLIKTLIETGWYFHNPLLGAPGQFNFIDWPMSDATQFLIIKFIALFSHDYVVVMNVYYYVTFILTAFISYYVFRSFALKQSFAIVASVLYSILPYHFISGEAHLLLSGYYAVPIYILLCIQLFSSAALKKTSGKKYLGYILLLTFAASSGVYYAFYACCLLLTAGLLSSIDYRNSCPLLKSFALVLIISSVVVANISPLFYSIATNGFNRGAITRDISGSELYSLKIAQMLLPTDGHRVMALNQFKQRYNLAAPLVNENTSASLGVLGAIGFLSSLFILLAKKTGISERDNILYHLSRLNLMALLIGTVGGLGVFATILTDYLIRSHNRISVFIAFIALYTFFQIIQTLLQKRFPNLRESVYCLIAIELLCIGYYDQVGTRSETYNRLISDKFHSDQQFVGQLEKSLPQDSKVFELPFMLFPEGGFRNQMTDYEQSRGYLHSQTLHWSYGAMRGRPNQLWQVFTASMSTEKMIAKLINSGFAGLMIDRAGYTDHAVWLQSRLTTLLHQQPVESPDKTFIFYYLNQGVA